MNYNNLVSGLGEIPPGGKPRERVSVELVQF